MLGIEDYGSDSDSSRPSTPQPAPAKPSASSSQSASAKPQRAPKKITIALPVISAPKHEDENDVEVERPSKKRKTGAGVSSLLSMLPTPKETNPIAPTQRVLGGGSGPGLKFHSSSRGQAESYDSKTPVEEVEETEQTETIAKDPQPSTSALFRPTHVAKGKKNISLEESSINQPTRTQSQPTPKPAPATDFFSFSSLSSNSSTQTPKASTITTASTPSAPNTFSSAPAIPTFEPPEPTPTDPYPGYYQLPSGAWAAYEVEYYGKFMKKWEREYNAHVRALEKGDIKGFEGLQNADVEEIDALKEMEKAKKEIQEREARKAVTAGADGGPVAPKMNINVFSILFRIQILTASKFPTYRRTRRAASLVRDISCLRCLKKHTKTGKRWKRELLKASAIAKKQEINMVSNLLVYDTGYYVIHGGSLPKYNHHCCITALPVIPTIPLLSLHHS